MYFVSIYENRRMKLVEIVLNAVVGAGRVNLRYIVSTYVKIIIYIKGWGCDSSGRAPT
jgi:hypothetical protein